MTVAENPSAQATLTGEPISMRDVRKTYPSATGPTVVLDGISLDIAPGELISLVGPSGCGKSTLLKILAGLIPFDAGTVALGGEAPVSYTHLTLPTICSV